MTTNATEGHAGAPRAERATIRSSRLLSLSMPLLDVFAGAILALVALSLWVGASYIERSESGLMGPAGFPRGVALIFAAISLVMAIRGAIECYAGRGAAVVEIAQPLAVLAAMIMVLAYPLLLGYFNYYLVTGPWLIGLLLVTGTRRPSILLGCALGFLLFAKLVFETLMGIPLP